MEYPFPKWLGKPVLFSRHASEEALNDNIPAAKILETLEEGVETKEKRRKGVLELVKGFKDEVLKVVVADRGDCWLVVTVIRFKR
ncbi:hypothetical protein COT29_01710 [Candidatus Micrarchaeota archaeon CG08_land_8_20_14_0_20_59_11]|nr:MAG: hypothetical protein COT29_01710 [Candidatus Micrarchaeota archaeon CG08_land_8_20_14_0_20_59_11]PIT85068.1 MAG: hypothetical protein COU36_05375 [Candidatus Micrarchaeota archaeon CG10_big_fil_rev_8_21_14_0_10_59_7]